MTDAGSAHKVAAAAMAQEFERLFPGRFEVKTIDLFKVADIQPFNTSDASYAFMSGNQTFEAINNIAYRFFNTAFGYDFFYKYTNGLLLAECENIIKEEEPDIVISLHPVVGTVVRAIKEKMKGLKTVQVILDPVTIFRGWADPNADLIISPTGEAVNSLVQYGVEISKIVYPLYPIKPNMGQIAPKDEVMKRLKLNKYRPIILLTGGGVGTKALKNAIKMLADADKYQVIILAGRQETFRQQLENKYGKNPNIKILGYIDNIQDLYNICDVMIAKPSAYTVMEAELFDMKVVWTRYIGHHDSGNVAYVKRNPMSRYIGDDWDSLISSADELLALNPREPAQEFKRSFDECAKIVQEIAKLAD